MTDIPDEVLRPKPRTDTPDEALQPTAEEFAILKKLGDRFKGFTFKTTPPVEVPEKGVVCGLMAQRRPKTEWHKLRTAYPVDIKPEDDEQILRLIERELMNWGDGTTRDREPDGAPQYPQMGRRY
mgnify:CR=1 FL=1